ncbi:MAG: hypothetical protein JWN38_186 [Candidatus Saccharibacteria bacterium]|nr:hypothetical protein [Candidatus Saccharibacteria bacterium]
MRLSEPLIAKFQQAHLEEFGEAISVETAEAELLDLAELVLITQSARIVDIENRRNDG